MKINWKAFLLTAIVVLYLTIVMYLGESHELGYKYLCGGPLYLAGIAIVVGGVYHFIKEILKGEIF